MRRVSVIIPTVGRRPYELLRAVVSALDQGEVIAEILVVVDLPERLCHLPRFEDPRVKVLVKHSLPRGPAAARNYGVMAASSELVAFLDDDDYWIAGKIERQLNAWHPNAVVATRVRVVQGHSGDMLQPDMPSRSSQRLADYLFPAPGFRRSSNRSVYPSSWLSSSELLRAHPFDESLTHWEDLNWLLGVVDQGVEFLWVWEPLTVCDHTRVSGVSQSQVGSADEDAAWAAAALRPRSVKAYQNHMLSYAVPGHAQAGAPMQAVQTLIGALRHGPTHPALLAKALVGITVPRAVWNRVKQLRHRRRP